MMPLSAYTAPLRAKLEASLQRRQAQAAALREAMPDTLCLECLDSGYVSLMGTETPCPWCATGKDAARDEDERRRSDWLASIEADCGIPAQARGWHFGRCDPRVAGPVEILAGAGCTGGRHDSLYLYGGNGRGKTVLGGAVLRENVRRFGERLGYHQSPRLYGQFITAPQLLESLRPDSNRPEAPALRLQRYQATPVLVLDDLGSERLTEWGADRLFSVINERHAEQRQTIITSNYSLDALEQKVNRAVGGAGTRIVDRLHEFTAVPFGNEIPSFRRWAQ